MALGWRILKQGNYKVAMPMLSSDEEEFVAGMASRFKEYIRISEFRGEAEIREMLHNILVNMAKENGVSLDKGQQKYLVEAAFRHIYGLAFFDELLKDPEIEEIAVIGLCKPVYVFVAGKGWKMAKRFDTWEEAYSAYPKNKTELTHILHTESLVNEAREMRRLLDTSEKMYSPLKLIGK